MYKVKPQEVSKNYPNAYGVRTAILSRLGGGHEPDTNQTELVNYMIGFDSSNVFFFFYIS